MTLVERGDPSTQSFLSDRDGAHAVQLLLSRLAGRPYES